MTALAGWSRRASEASQAMHTCAANVAGLGADATLERLDARAREAVKTDQVGTLPVGGSGGNTRVSTRA